MKLVPRLPPERQLRLLDEWFSNHRTIRSLEVAAECLNYIGTRRDLEFLGRYRIGAGDDAEIERIKDEPSAGDQHVFSWANAHFRILKIRK